MATPRDHLPTCTIRDVSLLLGEIGFPAASHIEPLHVGAEYHKIFRLAFASSISATTADDTELVNHQNISRAIIRISGPHIPTIKTENEVGILSFLRTKTSIPVPQVLHFDSSRDNAVHNEYIIQELCSGVNGSEIYNSLTPTQTNRILEQLADFCIELHSFSFHHIGGISNCDTSQPSPYVSEHFWHLPDIEACFPSDVSFDILNPNSPTGYPSCTAWYAAQLRCYINAIKHKPAAFDWMSPDAIAQLEKFITTITTEPFQTKLNDVPLRLAHLDLHFDNLLLTPSLKNAELYNISAVLDWEFSSVVPSPLWRHSFLWCGIRNDNRPYGQHRKEREQLYKIWEDKMREKGMAGRQMLKDSKWKYRAQIKAWDAVNYMRCVVEVCPRGKQLEDAKKWWDEVLRSMRVVELVGATFHH